MSDAVFAWTDGACYPNPNGWGGWAAVMLFPDRPDHLVELSGHEAATTNNRMEMTAVLRALESSPAGSEVVITLDSQYVCNPYLKEWIVGWRSNGFAGRPNADLWKQLDKAIARHARVSWVWVRGHEDNVRHNRADALAVAARIALYEEARAAGEEYNL